MLSCCRSEDIDVERPLFVARLGEQIPRVIGGVDADLDGAAKVEHLACHLAAIPAVVLHDEWIQAGKRPRAPVANYQRLVVEDKVEVARGARVVVGDVVAVIIFFSASLGGSVMVGPVGQAILRHSD